MSLKNDKEMNNKKLHSAIILHAILFTGRYNTDENGVENRTITSLAPGNG